MQYTLWNDRWKFWPEGNAFALAWNVPPEAETVCLPHDAMIASPADPESPNGSNTGYRNSENYVYVKTLRLEEGDRRRHILRFEGVYCRAMVFVNENHVATCPNGYSTFEADLTDYLLPGGNEVRVLVRNAGMPSSRWYSGGGIYRDVWLLRSGPVYLDPNGLRVRTEQADEDLSVLLAEAGLVNRSSAARELRVICEILDAAGKVCAADETLVSLGSGARRTVRRRISLDRPALWGETHPALYILRCRLMEGDTELDSALTRFGVRTLSLDPCRGLRVNGEKVKLRGACIHHDNGLLGAAACPEAERRRVRLLKAAGFNAVRMSHHPASRAMLDACDEEGVFVMDELTDMWNRPKSRLDYAQEFEANWRDDVERMVSKDFNHPSVVLYSVGNEIPEIGTARGSNTCAEICALLHRLDPARYTTAGINGVFTIGRNMDRIVADMMGAAPSREGEEHDDADVNEFMAVMMENMDKILLRPELSRSLELASDGLDAVGYNYMTERYLYDAERYPNRVLVGSETYPPQIAENWALVERLPNLIGDFTWTGWDYIGEAGIGVPGYGPDGAGGGFSAGWPVQLAYCGDIDITGFRRPASYWREIVYGLRTTPYAAVQDPAHYGEQRSRNPWVFTDAVAKWDWPGFEGHGAVVEVYAPGDEAELLLDSVSLGRRPLTECRAIFDTVYRPGELTAVAYAGDKEIGRFTMRTPGEAAGLRVEREYADGALLWLAVSPVDTAGEVCAGHDITVKAKVEGAEMLGFGSGDPRPVHNYNEGMTKTWNGRAVLILRRHEEDAIRVHAESEVGSADWNG